MSAEFDAVKRQIQQIKEQADFTIKAKNEVIAQLNSMYQVSLKNRDTEIERLKSQLEKAEALLLDRHEMYSILGKTDEYFREKEEGE